MQNLYQLTMPIQTAYGSNQTKLLCSSFHYAMTLFCAAFVKATKRA